MGLSSYLKSPGSRDVLREPMAHIRTMSTANKHSASRIRRVGRNGIHIVSGRMRRASSAPKLSATPLSAPADILLRMPAQAVSPALLQLLDLMSGPLLLIQDSPAGEPREKMPPRRARVLTFPSRSSDFPPKAA